MKIEYTLEQENLIEFHLFSISQNKTLTKNMRISKLMLAGLFAFFAINVYNSGNIKFAIILGVFMIFSLIFYNKLYRHKVKTLYSKTIKQNYSKRIGKKQTIEFSFEELIVHDNMGESKTKISEIEKVDEIPNAYFIKLRNDTTLIIPKKDIEDINLLKEKFRLLNFKIIENLSWRWE